MFSDTSGTSDVTVSWKQPAEVSDTITEISKVLCRTTIVFIHSIYHVRDSNTYRVTGIISNERPHRFPSANSSLSATEFHFADKFGCDRAKRHCSVPHQLVPAQFVQKMW
jgi:hypothetical protein